MIAAHPYLITLGLILLGVAVSTIVSTFEDPDHDPSTPPPGWVVPFIIVQRVLTLVAPQGTVGIGGSKYSIPLFHYPKPSETPPGASGKLPPGAVAILLIPLLLLSACWKAVLRESVIELEHGHAEVTAKAQEYDKKKQAELRDRYAAAKTQEQVEAVRSDQKAYEAARAKFAEIMNKIWAVILQIKATLPLIERATDAQARAKVTAWITEGMGWLLQGKDTLSAFGVTIGGLQ